MGALDEHILYCTHCEYDLRLLTINRCPECGLPFPPWDERCRTPREEVADLEAAERATTRAVFRLAVAVMFNMSAALLVLALMGPLRLPMNDSSPLWIIVGLPTALFAVEILWFTHGLAEGLRADDFRGAVGAFLAFLIWVLVAAFAQLLVVISLLAIE